MFKIGQVAGAATDCNVCSGTEFKERGSRGNAICQSCESDVRTRVMWMMLQASGLLKPGARVLHFAPERPITVPLRAVIGDGYEPVDLYPERFPFVPSIRKFDLVRDVACLPSLRYDLVIHSHVIEHVPCNITAVLFHLHRSLKSSGMHLCCIPITRGGHYAEDLGKLDEATALDRFGQKDHVRAFGALDIERTLGMIFNLPERYDLLADFDEATLVRHGISPVAWSGWSPNSVLRLRKQDMLLSAQHQPRGGPSLPISF